MRSVLLATLLAILPLAAGADPIVDAIHKLDHAAAPSSITSGPVPGLATVVVNGQTLFVSTDGRFVIQGELYDLKQGADLSAVHRNSYRRDLVAKIPMRDRIVFAPAKPLYKVAVFVDLDCGYCRAMVSQVEGYLKEGIQLEFISYPRAGAIDQNGKKTATFAAATNVWCSPDRRAALLAAFEGQPASPSTCRAPIEAEMKLANDLQIVGTPGVVAESGEVVGGYLPPAALRSRLDEAASRSAIAKRIEAGRP